MRMSPLQFGAVLTPRFIADRPVSEETKKNTLQQKLAEADRNDKNAYWHQLKSGEYVYLEDNVSRSEAAATGKTIWHPKGWAARLNPFNYHPMISLEHGKLRSQSALRKIFQEGFYKDTNDYAGQDASNFMIMKYRLDCMGYDTQREIETVMSNYLSKAQTLNIRV